MYEAMYGKRLRSVRYQAGSVFLILNKKIVFSIALLASMACFFIYLPALTCGFVNLDDPEYLLNNTAIRSMDGDFWYWAFATFPLNYWLPVLWISFAVDYHFWGLNPFGYHLTNNILHAFNTGLVVLIADGLYRDKLSSVARVGNSKYIYSGMLLLAGLIFGVHPARVESVAWVTERKDVLNGLFTFGSIIFYLRYLKRKESTSGTMCVSWDYCLSVLLFLVSLTSKPSSIFIPIALLVIDWYPLGRLKRGRVLALMLEKVPFMVPGVMILLVSIILRAQEGGFNTLADFPLAVRAAAAGNGLMEYFRFMLFPVGILPYFALPRPVPFFYIYKAAAAAGLLCISFLLGRKLSPLAASVIFFVITIFPGLHFVTDGAQTICSLRYSYLPSLLPSIILAAMIGSVSLKVAQSWPRRGTLLFCCLGFSVVMFYSVTTQDLIGDWRDSGTMWTRVIDHQPFEKAYFYRGSFYAEKGDYHAAINDYTTCLMQATVRTLPQLHNVYAYRGYALMKIGNFEDAVDDFTVAISMRPYNIYYYYRGTALKSMGMGKEAEDDFNKAGEDNGKLYWLE
jgi:hypothetical protein